MRIGQKSINNQTAYKFVKNDEEVGKTESPGVGKVRKTGSQKLERLKDAGRQSGRRHEKRLD
jgi:hypothetical protein